MMPNTTRPPCENPRSRPFRHVCLSALAATAMTASSLAAIAATPLTVDQRAALKPTFTTVDHAPLDMAKLQDQAAKHQTIPFWQTSVTSPVDGQTYSYNMVGKSPYAMQPGRAFVHYVQIIARIHFPDGTVLDPTGPSACDSDSVADRFFNSPLFVKSKLMSNGVDITKGDHGGEQLISAFQRANYWSAVQGTDYGVVLQPIGKPIVVDVTAPADAQVYSFPIQCASGAIVNINLGAIDINEYDALVQSAATTYAKPDQVPMFLSYNVVQTEGGGCCIIGYHNAIPVATGTQVYAVGAYVDPGIFVDGNNNPIPLEDIYPWSHEMGELIDDPFVQGPFKIGRQNNRTPAWGHTGQVSHCQDNLEVGDPLTGVAFIDLTGEGGFVYHVQDLAFHDWFYRTPSQGTGGMYSLFGTFASDAGPLCAHK